MLIKYNHGNGKLASYYIGCLVSRSKKKKHKKFMKWKHAGN
jgi:hypothetical protein